MARPKKGEEHPREHLRTPIKLLAGNGVPHADIAAALRVGTDTLHRFYKEELDCGLAELKLLAVTEWTKAMKKGEQWALKLFLSARMGISDKIVHEGGDPDRPIQHTITRKIVRPGDVTSHPGPDEAP
jgi:hypothetical protein